MSLKFPDFPACSECGFKLWTPVIEMEHTFVALYDDGRYPGRCIVSAQEHWDHLDDMVDSHMADFMSDVLKVGRAIREVTDAPRANYAVLGNAVPHVHAHVFPRQLERDPVPNSSPWNHPKKVYPLKPESKKRIILDLRKAILRQMGAT